MTEPSKPTDVGKHLTPKEPDRRLVQAEELFQGQREIWIEHAGVRYRLQITRRNRLILQK